MTHSQHWLWVRFHLLPDSLLLLTQESKRGCFRFVRFYISSDLNSSPVSNSLWNIFLFVFPKCAVTWTHGHRSHWGKIGESSLHSLAMVWQGPSSRIPRILFSRYIQISKMAQGQGLVGSLLSSFSWTPLLIFFSNGKIWVLSLLATHLLCL